MWQEGLPPPLLCSGVSARRQHITKPSLPFAITETSKPPLQSVSKAVTNYQGNVSGRLEKKGASLPGRVRPLEPTDVGKMPTKTQHEPRRRGTPGPGRAGTVVSQQELGGGTGPPVRLGTSVRRLEDRQQIPRRHLPAGGAVPMQTLEVGPRKLATFAQGGGGRDEGEGGNSFYSKQTNNCFASRSQKREREKNQRECFWKSTKIHFG